jgi:hypothetical protein
MNLGFLPAEGYCTPGFLPTFLLVSITQQQIPKYS